MSRNTFSEPQPDSASYGIDNTHGIDLNAWYSIGTPELHTYERDERCSYAGFFSSHIPSYLLSLPFFLHWEKAARVSHVGSKPSPIEFNL